MGSSSKKKKKTLASGHRPEVPTINLSGDRGASVRFKMWTVCPGLPSRNRSDPNQKVLFMQEQQAMDMSVSTHDLVLALQLDQSHSSGLVDASSLESFLSQLQETHPYRCIAVCQVQRISGHKQEQTTLSAPSWFMHTVFDTPNTLLADTDTQLNPSPTTTTTPRKHESTFTFTHLLTNNKNNCTPSSMSSPSPSHHLDFKRNNKAQAGVPLWLIPIQDILTIQQHTNQRIHILGKADLVTLLCIEPYQVPSTLHPSTLQLLLLSFCNHSYVSPKDVLIASIHGQKVLFHITQIQQDKINPNSTTPCIFQIHTKTQFHILNHEDQLLSSFRQLSLSSNHETVLPTRKQIIAGMDTLLQQIYSNILPTLLGRHNTPQSFSWIQPSKGLLLHGPHGVGKSLLAQQIVLDLEYYNQYLHKGIKPTSYHPFPMELHGKPIAVEWVSSAHIQAMSSFVGEGEKILTQIFDQAQYKAYHKDTFSLIILDDIDLICPTRSFHHGSNPTDRIASTLLALLDGIGTFNHLEKKMNPTFVLAITSKPMMLDPALRRAGRMDQEIEVPIPDETGRAEIYSFLLSQLQSSQIQLDPGVLSCNHLTLFSKISKGFTGADCALSIKEALRDAMGHCTSGDGTITLTVDHIHRAIRRTKPSSIKSISVEIPCVPWSSIGGMSHVKQQLREAIEYPLKYAHLYKAMNIPPPKGILLYGPPGCSKTLMARALATEGHMNFLAVKGPELLSKWLGESERALASLFHRARMASPCVIFFDEIDAIGSQRGHSDGSTGGDRLLSQLLTELDGVSTPSDVSTITMYDDGGNTKEQPRVVVVGATNRPDLLDSALIRPGRIDRMIYVGIPDELSRADIFRIALKNKACGMDVDPDELAKDQISGGFSGAEIVSICQEAAIFAIEEFDEMDGLTEGPKVCRRHLMKSIQVKNRQITPEMLEFYESFAKKI